MLNLAAKIKLDLFNALKKEPNAFGQDQHELGYLPFLDTIWPLRTMPSTDPRFTNAYDDIRQHTVNNFDWDIDYVFLDRLKLLEDNEAYNRFLEALVSPQFRKTEDEIIKFVLLINAYLEKETYLLAVSDASGAMPIYTLQSRSNIEILSADGPRNKVPFFVVKKPTGRSDRPSSHERPAEFPCFVLSFNDGWNDYSVRSIFTLFYYNENGNVHTIGDTKIIHEKEENTASALQNRFKNLSDKFCSLGQSFHYYRRIKDLLGKDFESVLFALKDSAFFPQIHELFETNSNFLNSLVRNDEAEQILRVAKYELYGYDLSNLYSFKYSFQPAYASNSVDVFFDFETESNKGSKALAVPNRIYALIGKNGTGKTQLITSLPMKISKKEDESFIPRAPLFSKVIAVSYSVFDKFELPRKTATFNYVYCGLRSGENENISERGLLLRFHSSWKKIESHERIDKWRHILSNFIDEELLNEFLIPKKNEEIRSLHNSFKVSNEGFSSVRKKLSSGQNIVLYIISEIVANIRYDSLLLYDEPETHLHPNAITQLMNTIYELVEEFKSYCIIATHSPLIIRELLSKNVYVVEREQASVSVRRIGMESFGENLTTLTDEVFGNKEVPKQYKKIIQSLIREGKHYQEIVSLLEYDEVPLSMNTRIYIKSQFAEK